MHHILIVVVYEWPTYGAYMVYLWCILSQKDAKECFIQGVSTGGLQTGYFLLDHLFFSPVAGQVQCLFQVPACKRCV